jgi:hypothetical protein
MKSHGRLCPDYFKATVSSQGAKECMIRLGVKIFC